MMKRFKYRDIAIMVCWFVLFAGTFLLLDLQSVPTGDDLGYMFADSAHHACDGKRALSLKDITATQASHYIHCNGRFIIHWLTMFFLNIGGHLAFCIVNSIIYFLTICAFFKLSLPYCGTSKYLWSFPLFATLLWFCVPQPGVTWLSLVSYSTNYLWSAAANLWLFYFFLSQKAEKHIFVSAPIALLTGSLQESFSLPISCALFIYLIINRRKADSKLKIFILSYWIGTAICFFAPGNLQHARQGGGLVADALSVKLQALGTALVRVAPIIPAFFLLLICRCIANIKNAQRFISANLIWFCTVIFALILAGVSFTSPRQLTCPSIACGILIVRLLISLRTTSDKKDWLEETSSPDEVKLDCRKITKIYKWLTCLSCLIIYLAVFAGVYSKRQITSECFRSLHAQASAGERVIVHDLNFKNQTTHRNIVVNAFDFSNLPVVFDGYTKRGLSRLYNGDRNSGHLTTILPSHPETIFERARTSKIGKDRITTAFLTTGYRCAWIPEEVPVSHLRNANGKPVPFERLRYKGGNLLVVPDNSATHILKCKTIN